MKQILDINENWNGCYASSIFTPINVEKYNENVSALDASMERK